MALQQSALRKGDLRCSVVSEDRMPLAALVSVLRSLDTGCTALPVPVSVQLLEPLQGTLHHQEENVLGSVAPTLSLQA